MPVPAGPLPQPSTVRPYAGKVTRPVAGSADPSRPGNVQ